MTYFVPEGLISRVESASGPYSDYCCDSPESDIDRRLRQPTAQYLPADSTSTLNQYFRTIDSAAFTR